jgi:hypothetical protein
MRQNVSISALLLALCGCLFSCGGGGGNFAFAQKDTATKTELEKRLADLDRQCLSNGDPSRAKMLDAEIRNVRDQLVTADLDARGAGAVSLEQLNREMRPQRNGGQISLSKLHIARQLWETGQLARIWKWRTK